VRNDTGVYEGGEISRFYDPMIAKLCTWAPDRAQAIEGMRNALDAFEVEGIGHNLPFLAAVMDHPRFISGDISTAFIAEEYPDGFMGAAIDDAALERLAAAAIRLKMIRERRDAHVTGALSNHEREVGSDMVVTLAKQVFAGRARNGDLLLSRLDGPAAPKGFDYESGRVVPVSTEWTPGDTLARLTVDGVPMTIKVDPLTEGFRLRYRGADLTAIVRTPHIARLAALMPEKLPPDTSKMLLCPMPGLVVSIAVKEGDEVQDGQALAVVEAMKMENVLRAERSAKVRKINAAPGASLAVDEVIMEFE
jgi:propionyl-CoA carboxylase alpha chain